MFFFFQAEDGIRDLVRSRGLVDVYKRQGKTTLVKLLVGLYNPDRGKIYYNGFSSLDIETVSYTHLTLPTSDLV